MEDFDDVSGRVMKGLRTANRFDNYREIYAKFDSMGACGHPIKKGDLIGYNKRHGCQCKECWAKWSAENREADMLEQSGSYCL
jgi:hypothetical protein